MLTTHDRLLPLAGALAPERRLAAGSLRRPADDPCTDAFSAVAERHAVGARSLDQLIERLPVAIMIAEPSGRVAYANAVARKWGVDDLDPVVRAIAFAIVSGQAVHEESVEWPTRAGPRRWLSVSVLPVRAQGFDAASAALVTVRETSAERRADEWLPLVRSLVNL